MLLTAAPAAPGRPLSPGRPRGPYTGQFILIIMKYVTIFPIVSLYITILCLKKREINIILLTIGPGAPFSPAVPDSP